MQGQAEADQTVQDGKVVLNAESLKAWRKQRGLSQEALAQQCLARRLCVSIASIKRAETGKSVLYRTANHLARVFERDVEELIRLPSAQPGAATNADAVDAFEQRTVLALQLWCAQAPPAALLAQLGQVAAQFGGQDGGPGLFIFGLPKAYGSDAVRCLQAGVAIAQQLGGHGAALAVRTLDWPSEAGAADLPAELPTGPLPFDAGAAPLYVAAALRGQLSERFALAPQGWDGAWLRVTGALAAANSASCPLVARYVELQQFKATLATTQAYQCGHILYLRGVAGIGKSRLIQEFTDIAEQSQFSCHTAVICDFGVRGDDAPLAQLLRSLLGIGAGTLPDEALLAERMDGAGVGAELAMHYRALLGMPQPGADAVLYGAMAHHTRDLRQIEALRELIIHRAIDSPLLLVLEDIHWGTPALLATLAALLPDVGEAPLVWVLSSRFEHDPMEHALRPYLNGLPVTMLDLATLRPPEAMALAQYASDPDPDFHAKCVARAQGNPLFLTQLLLSGRSHALPSSLKNLVQSKLDDLPAPQRHGLRVASAIGQYFPLSLLREALQQPEHELGMAVRQCIVRPDGQGSFRFVHDLVMQGIYESMPAAQRDEVHVAIARCYGAGNLHLRAQHLDRARHADAPAAFLDAIRERIAGYQYQQALDLIEHCQRIDYAAREVYPLHLLSGQAHAKMGQTQHARASFEEALASAGDQRQRVAAVIGLAAALNVLEQLQAEEALLDATIAATRNAGVTEGLGELYYLKGNLYFPTGNFALSRQLHEQAQRHAISKETQARALSGMGDSYYAQGRMATAHRVFRDCLALCEQHGLAEIEASNRFMLGTVRIYLNQTAGALDDALASAELGHRVGNRRAEIVSRLTASWLLTSLGQAAGARQQIEQGLELARTIGAARFEPFLSESLVRVLLLEGRAGDAHALALNAWEMVERQKLHKFIGPWVLSTLALVEPNAQAREHALREGQALLEQGCVGHNHYRYYAGAMETCLLRHQPQAALALAARFAAYVAEEPCPWATHHIALVRSAAAWMAAPSADAQALLESARAAGEAAGLGGVMPLLQRRLLQEFEGA